MQKNTFVASTIYHIFLICLKQIKDGVSIENKSDALLVLIEHTPKIETLIPNLENSIFFSKVIIIPRKREQKKRIGTLKYTLQRKALIGALEKDFPALKKQESFIKNSTIYLCDTDSSKNYFFLKYKEQEMQMIEDGAITYQKTPKKAEYIKQKIFNNGFITNGHGKEISTVHAVLPQKLPAKLQPKAVALNIENIGKNLDNSIKKALYAIFNFSLEKYPKTQKKAIILTQPLSEDGFLASEADKIALYQKIKAKIPADYQIFIKTHPRETTDYTKHFLEVTWIPNLFPIELLNLQGGIAFEKGYTLFSTALSNLTQVKEKHFSALEFIADIPKKKHQDIIRQTMSTYFS